MDTYMFEKVFDLSESHHLLALMKYGEYWKITLRYTKEHPVCPTFS